MRKVAWLGWGALALFAAMCLATLALSRGETVGALWIVSAAVSVFCIGYRVHARYIAEKALRIDPTRATPAWRRNDGLDYVPTQKSVLFGQHLDFRAHPAQSSLELSDAHHSLRS